MAKLQTEDPRHADYVYRYRSWQHYLPPVEPGNRSQVVVRKKFSRQQLLLYTANLSSSLIGMEACVGSHFRGRALREQGHEVRLMPAVASKTK